MVCGTFNKLAVILLADLDKFCTYLVAYPAGWATPYAYKAGIDIYKHV